MKKATLSIALLSLVVLTSFTTIQDTGETGGDGASTTTTPTTTSDRQQDTGGSGGQDVGGNKKHDFMQPLPVAMQYPNQEIPSFRKSDF